jgi:hypothetical protein
MLHDTIIDHLAALRRRFGKLAAKRAKSQIPVVKEALLSYQKELLPHLHWEEETIVPLMRAYFTSAEISKIVQEIVETDPPPSMGSFIHFQGESRFRKVFMNREDFPFYAWKSKFRGFYRAFQDSFLKPYQALKADTSSVSTKRPLLSQDFITQKIVIASPSESNRFCGTRLGSTWRGDL